MTELLVYDQKFLFELNFFYLINYCDSVGSLLVSNANVYSGDLEENVFKVDDNMRLKHLSVTTLSCFQCIKTLGTSYDLD